MKHVILLKLSQKTILMEAAPEEFIDSGDLPVSTLRHKVFELFKFY
ncbi:MAG: hypothetical protein ACFFDI_30720 [Promethearchaeota archaeon]